MYFAEAFQRNRGIVALLGVVVIVHGTLYIHILRNFPDVGSAHDGQYTNIAAHIVRDGVYSMGSRDTDGRLLPTASVPPLYTYLYAASYRVFGIGSTANEPMRIVQMLANIGVIVVVWRIGMLFSARAANVAAVFAALDFTAFFFAQDYDIPDTLLGLFMALWLYFFVRFLRKDPSVRSIALSACFLGLAMWTKITPFLLWVPMLVLLAVFLWRSVHVPMRTKMRAASVFVLIMLLFFGGWKIRNRVVVGTGSFASGATSLRWNAAHLIAYQQDITLADARMDLAARYFPETLLARGEGAVEREGGRAMVRLILGSPIDFGVVVLRAMPGFFFGTFPPYLFASATEARVVQARVTESRGHLAMIPLLWSEGRIGYVLAYVFAKGHLVLLYGASIVAAVIFLARREFRWTLACFAITILYTVAVSGAAAQARYRTVIFPIFYLMSGYGIVYLGNRIRGRWSRGGVFVA